MKYPFHTTTHEQRLKLLEQKGKEITINVDDFLCPSIAHEDTGELYVFDYEDKLDTLTQFDNGVVDYMNTEYYNKWVTLKGHEYCRVRVTNFCDLYEDIKKNGLKELPVVDNTGQKIDGSHRVAIMKHLGHKTVEAKVVELTDVDEDFIKRTLKAREMLYGKNYYFIDYGGFQNISGDVSDVYKENSYDRWEVLKDLIKGTVLDLGCNEGFISLQCALAGHETVGIEYEFADGANFNKVIFEHKHGKLPVKFIEGDITDCPLPYTDTCLLLNVIYHVPKSKQVELLKNISSKRIIFQGNLRKAHEVEKFRGCTVETIKELCELAGKKVTRVIEWRDKPLVICEG